MGALPVIFALLFAGSAPGPPDLVTKLLQTSVRSSELPAGFTAFAPATIPLSPNARKYGAVGKVGVLVRNRGFEVEEIVYEVFPDKAHAVADVRHPALTKTAQLKGPVPGLENSSTIFDTATGNTVLTVAAVRENVLVQALAISAGRTKPAIDLLHAAIAHLRRLQSTTT